MNTMMYKGYVGEVEYDDEYKIFSGSVINTRTVITFQGGTLHHLSMSDTPSGDCHSLPYQGPLNGKP